MGLYYSFKKQENIKTFYLRRITKLLPTYLILGIPYWIYFDCFLNKMNIGQVFIDISFISFITEGNRRFWFIGLILGLYLFFPITCFYLQGGYLIFPGAFQPFIFCLLELALSYQICFFLCIKLTCLSEQFSFFFCFFQLYLGN